MMKKNYVNEIKEDLEKAKNVCLSLYLWKCEPEVNPEEQPKKTDGICSTYLCTVVHYFDSNWNMQSRFLKINFVETAQNPLENSEKQIESYVEEVLNEFIIKSKVNSMISIAFLIWFSIYFSILLLRLNLWSITHPSMTKSS